MATATATPPSIAAANLWALWKQTFLAAIGAPDTPANERFLNAWALREGTSAKNNPFATTQTAPGSYSLPGNPAGVQQYPDVRTGAIATAQTLQNGLYGDVLSALRSGTASTSAGYAGLRTWSGGGYSSLGGSSGGPGGAPPSITANQGGSPGTTASGSTVGPQGWGGLVIGVVQMLAGGALLLIGIVLAAKMAADAAGLDFKPSEVPVVGARAKAGRARRATEAVELTNRQRTSDARAAEAESRAQAASSRAVSAQRGPRTTVHSPGVRPYRPKLGTPAAEVRAERRRRGLAVEDDSNPPF